jgi:hypothetical protein
MTHMHKLAGRLARLRDFLMFGALLLAAACSAGEPTGPQDTAANADGLPVAVAPRRVTLEARQAALFKAYNRGGTLGDSLLTSIEWTATGGTIGSDGSFSSDASGEVRVIGIKRGKQKQVADTAVVVIVPPQPDLSSISVTPGSATIPSGSQQTFTATGQLTDGTQVPVGIDWSATGGSIDAGGTFTAGSSTGTFKVIAKAASTNIADTVSVTVTAPATLDGISLSPASASLVPGQSQVFEVRGRMSDGSTTSVTNATFSASGGTIDGGGFYTAGNTGGSFQVTASVATSSGGQFTATANITINAGTAGYTNQPSGFGRIAELSASGLLPDQRDTCSGYGIIAGCWYRYDASLSLATDATAPQSPSSVLQYTWPAGLPIGTSAGMFGGWSGASGGEGTGDQYSRVYESGWIKLVGTSFEAPDPGMKLLGYWGVGQANDPSRVANQIYGFINGGTHSSFTLQICQQNQVSRCMSQNVNGSPLLVVGQWVHYEILMTLNSVDVSDGGLKVWINGQQTHNYSNVMWRTSGSPTGFYGRRWDPIWGGMGNPPTKTKTDRMLVDHVYISGVR